MIAGGIDFRAAWRRACAIKFQRLRLIIFFRRRYATLIELSPLRYLFSGTHRHVHEQTVDAVADYNANYQERDEADSVLTTCDAEMEIPIPFFRCQGAPYIHVHGVRLFKICLMLARLSSPNA